MYATIYLSLLNREKAVMVVIVATGGAAVVGAGGAGIAVSAVG